MHGVHDLLGLSVVGNTGYGLVLLATRGGRWHNLSIMIDGKARAELRSVVEDYLSDRVLSNTFDDRLTEVCSATDDETVQLIGTWLWGAYDDFVDHTVHLQKPDWDTLQRCLLVLDSGAELRRQSLRVSHRSQGIAAVAFALQSYLLIVHPVVLVWTLLVGGIVAAILYFWRGRVVGTEHSDPWHAWPFPSLAALKRALLRAPHFRKQRHRPEIAARPVEPGFKERLGVVLQGIVFAIFVPLPAMAIWCALSPLVFLGQCLGIRVCKQFFVEPESHAPVEVALSPCR